jgi:hypothetical protein
MTTYDSRPDTQDHIDKVADYLGHVSYLLERRASEHDASKLEDPEKSGWDEATPKLKELTYGSEEYRQVLRDIKPIVQHHYANNSHHPEFWGAGIDGMSLLDVIEMLCDWKAASLRTAQTQTFLNSLEYNKKRFEISDQLYNILVNTAKELGFD